MVEHNDGSVPEPRRVHEGRNGLFACHTGAPAAEVFPGHVEDTTILRGNRDEVSCTLKGGRMAPRRYVKPSSGTHVLNAVFAVLARVGISVYGSRILAVRGRTSGAWRTVPVNLLIHEGAQYLVAPRGETQWVRNLRVAKTGELRLGRRVEPFHAEELRDADKPPLLRAYLQKWAFEVKVFFDGVGADASDAELLRIAPNHPVFRIAPVVAARVLTGGAGQPAAMPDAASES